MDNSKYTDRIKYYQTLEQKLLPTDEERVYIKEASITLQGLDGIRLVKKSGGIFDRDTCNNFLKMSDLLSDEQLLHSIETIRDYTKEYTDSEVESDERIRQVKADSLEEIEYQIHLAKTILVLFGVFFPIGRAISWISEFRADRNLMSSILFATMPPTDDNGDLNKDIYLEICNEELDELLKKAEYNSPEIEDCKEVLRNIVSYSSTQSNDEFIDKMSGLFLYFTLYFYEPKILGAYFTTKEYNMLKERVDNVLTYLKEYYSGTQCTKLIHHFRNYVSASKSLGTVFYSTINEQTEFEWLKNSLNDANITLCELTLLNNNEETRGCEEAVESSSAAWLGESPEHNNCTDPDKFTKAIDDYCEPSKEIYPISTIDEFNLLPISYSDNYFIQDLDRGIPGWYVQNAYAYHFIKTYNEIVSSNHASHFVGLMYLLYISPCFNWKNILERANTYYKDIRVKRINNEGDRAKNDARIQSYNNFERVVCDFLQDCNENLEAIEIMIREKDVSRKKAMIGYQKISKPNWKVFNEWSVLIFQYLFNVEDLHIKSSYIKAESEAKKDLYNVYCRENDKSLVNWESYLKTYDIFEEDYYKKQREIKKKSNENRKGKPRNKKRIVEFKDNINYEKYTEEEDK